MIYRGTSLSLWALEALVVVSIIAFAVWLAFWALVALLLIAGAAVVAFLLWWGWLEARDRVLKRRRPTTIG